MKCIKCGAGSDLVLYRVDRKKGYRVERRKYRCKKCGRETWVEKE